MNFRRTRNRKPETEAATLLSQNRRSRIRSVAKRRKTAMPKKLRTFQLTTSRRRIPKWTTSSSTLKSRKSWGSWTTSCPRLQSWRRCRRRARNLRSTSWTRSRKSTKFWTSWKRSNWIPKFFFCSLFFSFFFLESTSEESTKKVYQWWWTMAYIWFIYRVIIYNKKIGLLLYLRNYSVKINLKK